MRFRDAVQRGRCRSIAALCCALLLAACGGVFDTDPLVEYSTDINVQADATQSFARQVRAGVYLVEVREHDIDLTVGVDADNTHTDLADAYLRHGLHRMVVSLR